MHHLADFVEQSADILPRAHHADGSRQNVIEYQRRNGDLGQNGPHAVANHDVNAAAYEHRAALHVNAAYGEAEQHHADDKPWGGGTYGPLRGTAGIEGRRSQIAEYDGRSAPETDEGKCYRRRHDHLRHHGRRRLAVLGGHPYELFYDLMDKHRPAPESADVAIQPAAESWQAEVDEIRRRAELARLMGGRPNIERQHQPRP